MEIPSLDEIKSSASEKPEPQSRFLLFSEECNHRAMRSTCDYSGQAKNE